MSPPHRIVLAAALIVVAGTLAYLNSFSGPLVFDDVPAIRENQTIRSLMTAWSPPANSGVGGRPLANVSFALNHAIGGEDVRGYHAGNLLLHLGSALLLFGIVRRTLRAPQPWLACGVAAVWVVHPLATAAVTWLSQRTELLMAFFHLATLYAFIRGATDGHRAWWIASVVACALGMMSKEVMVTAPLVVLLYDRTLVAGSFAAAWRARRGYYLGLAGTWLILGYLLTTGLHLRSVGFGLGVSPLQYALTESRAVLIYLKLAVWPAPLVFDYGALYAAPVAMTLSAVVLVALLLTATFMLVRRGAALGFAVACFFLLLAPTSTFVPVAEQPIAENRAYLPLAALLAGGVVAAHGIARRFNLAAWLAATAALGVMTAARNTDYQSAIRLWSDTVRKRPENPRAQYNCGVAMLDAGRPLAAAPHFERAIRLNPREPKFHHSLGNAYLEADRPAEAVPHFAAAVGLEPKYARAWYNYGLALMRSGDAAGAVDRFERSLALEPASAATHAALGNACFQLDRPAAALAAYEAALRLDPTYADAHYNAGSAALELRQFGRAVDHFAAAVRLKPTDPEIRNNYGAALLQAGRVTEAIAEFEHTLRLKPDYQDARDNLTVARRPVR